MEYSYIIDRQASEDSYKKARSAVEKLYPQFVPEKEIKNEGENETAVYAKGNERIYAEIDYVSETVRVTSDRRLDELADYLGISSDRKEKSYKTGIFAGSSLLTRKALLKYILIPLIIIFALIISSVISLLYFIDIVEMIFWVLGYCQGWIWLLPAIPLTRLAAQHKDPRVYKTIVYAMPVLAAVRFVLLAGENLAAYASEIITETSTAVFGGALSAVMLLLALYLAVIPYMILDDIGGDFYESCDRERPDRKSTAAGWGISAILTASVLLVTIAVSGIGEARAEKELAQKKEAVSAALSQEYDEDIRTVMEYARAHNYYDWENCPDPSVRGEWQRLFFEGRAKEKLDSSPRYTVCVYSGDLDRFCNAYYRPEDGSVEYDLFFLDYSNG